LLKVDGIGFDRRLEPSWMDCLAGKIIEGSSEEEIRTDLKEMLKNSIEGAEAISKTVTVLLRTWLIIPDQDKDIVDRAKELLQIVTAEERLWIHWGLIILRYRFVRDLAEIAGRLIDLQGQVS